MPDIDTGPNGAAARWRPAGAQDTGPFPGRHASRTEIAAETPIFHALTLGDRRSRRHEDGPTRAAAPAPAPLDPLSRFRRDPLTAPIPVQALVPVPSPSPSPTPRSAVVRQLRRTPAVPCAAVAEAPVTARSGAHALPERSGRHGRHQLVPTHLVPADRIAARPVPARDLLAQLVPSQQGVRRRV